MIVSWPLITMITDDLRQKLNKNKKFNKITYCCTFFYNVTNVSCCPTFYIKSFLNVTMMYPYRDQISSRMKYFQAALMRSFVTLIVISWFLRSAYIFLASPHVARASGRSTRHLFHLDFEDHSSAVDKALA